MIIGQSLGSTVASEQPAPWEMVPITGTTKSHSSGCGKQLVSRQAQNGDIVTANMGHAWAESNMTIMLFTVIYRIECRGLLKHI